MTITLIGLACLLGLLLIRVPLGFSMGIVGFIGLVYVRNPNAAVQMVGFEVMSMATNWGFVVLPLFILMGVFVARAGLADDLYDAANAWMGHMPGGLAMATVAACAGFASVSGSSGATAATMSKTAIPSMRKFKYADSFAAGTVAAGGTLGILIPPSAAMIVYGILTEIDIAALFIAGFLPGFLTVILYLAVIVTVVKLKPSTAPKADASDWATRWKTLAGVWGVVLLFVLIIGGIMAGIFTSSEAGAMGAVGAFIFAVFRRQMTFKIFFESLLEAALTTVQIFTVAIGALILNQFINLARFPEAILNLISSLNMAPIYIIFVILGIFVLLGMFVEGIAMILLTVPIFTPIIQGLGLDIIWFGSESDLDLIWFGVVMIMAVEISLITPPIGLNVFILKSMVPDIPLGAIFRGIMPFFVADIMRLMVVVLVPGVVLYLPSILGMVKQVVPLGLLSF
jgi:tripartite ATP-independent transporter DctM subunit